MLKILRNMGIDGFFLEPLSYSGHSSLTNIDPEDYGRRTDYPPSSSSPSHAICALFFLGSHL